MQLTSIFGQQIRRLRVRLVGRRVARLKCHGSGSHELFDPQFPVVDVRPVQRDEVGVSEGFEVFGGRGQEFANALLVGRPDDWQDGYTRLDGPSKLLDAEMPFEIPAKNKNLEFTYRC